MPHDLKFEQMRKKRQNQLLYENCSRHLNLASACLWNGFIQIEWLKLWTLSDRLNRPSTQKYLSSIFFPFHSNHVFRKKFEYFAAWTREMRWKLTIDASHPTGFFFIFLLIFIINQYFCIQFASSLICVLSTPFEWLYSNIVIMNWA